MENIENEIKKNKELIKDTQALLKENMQLIEIIKENIKLDNIVYKQLSFYKKFAFINGISFMILASFLIFFFMNIASK